MMDAPADLCFLPAHRLASEIAAGTLSSRDAVAAPIRLPYNE